MFAHRHTREVADAVADARALARAVLGAHAVVRRRLVPALVPSLAALVRVGGVVARGRAAGREGESERARGWRR